MPQMGWLARRWPEWGSSGRAQVKIAGVWVGESHTSIVYHLSCHSLPPPER